VFHPIAMTEGFEHLGLRDGDVAEGGGKSCAAILCCMPSTYRSALGPFHATIGRAAIIAFRICREWVCPCVCGFMGYSSFTRFQLTILKGVCWKLFAV